MDLSPLSALPQDCKDLNATLGDGGGAGHPQVNATAKSVAPFGSDAFLHDPQTLASYHARDAAQPSPPKSHSNLPAQPAPVEAMQLRRSGTRNPASRPPQAIVVGGRATSPVATDTDPGSPCALQHVGDEETAPPVPIRPHVSSTRPYAHPAFEDGIPFDVTGDTHAHDADPALLLTQYDQRVFTPQSGRPAVRQHASALRQRGQRWQSPPARRR